MATKFSYCRNCAAYCGAVFEVENNQIVSHRPDRDHALTKGFMCIKGDMAVEFHQGVEPRLTECLQRTADGRFQPIESASLMDDVAARIANIVQTHGPKSVALFYGTSGYAKAPTIPIAKDFMRQIDSPNLFSTMTLDQSAHWVTEGRMGAFKTGRAHFDDVDVMLLAGANPVLSHGTVYFSLPTSNQAAHLKALKARGGKLIVIDPRKTETAAHADLHIRPKPGFDAEIFAGIIRIILENGWHDSEFCARYATNLGALRDAVQPFTSALVAERAGISEDELRQAAEILKDARRPSISFGTGTSMASHPNTAAHMIYALNVLRGGFAREGDRIRNPGFFIRRGAEEGVYPAARSWESGPKLRSGHGQFYGEFPSSRLCDEILNDGPEKIRALIVVGGNPMLAMGSPDHVRAAFESLELLVVVDPRMTDTVKRAHYVVAPPMQYEVSDCSMLTDLTSPTPFVQYTAPVVEAPAGTLEEWRFFNGLANRLGLTLNVSPFGFGVETADPNAKLTLSMDRDWRTDDILAWQCEFAGLDFDFVRSQERGFVPAVEEKIVQAPAQDDGARLDLCPADVAAELNEIAVAAPAQSERKYLFTSRRIVESMNSAYRDSSVSRRRFDINVLYMHPSDMADEGLPPNADVEIVGDHGRIASQVRADATMRPGVVAMTHCWGSIDSDEENGRRGAHTGRLVSLAREHVQKIDGMPKQSALAVDIVRS